MPREITHWTALQRVSTLLPETNAMTPSVRATYLRSFRAFPQVAFLGAMAHDAPYYYKLGLHGFSQVAEYLHGSDGEDTLEPMRKLHHLAYHYASEHKQDILNAFILGFCSHIAVDAIFHPLVYYFTGNYFDPDPSQRHVSVTRHRLFETHLEACFRPQALLCSIHGQKTIWSLGTFLKQIPNDDLRFLAQSLASVTNVATTIPEHNLATMWGSSFSHMATIISLLHRKSIFQLLSTLRPCNINFLIKGEALCTWPRQAITESLEQPLQFRNPISGIERQTNIHELATESVNLVLDLLSKLHDETSKEPGPSLNFGIPEAPVSEARYFASEKEWESLGMS